MLNQRQFREAVALHRRGEYAEARARYEALEKSDPRNPHLLHFRGLLASHTGDMDGAVALLTKAIGFNANVPDFHRNLADIFLKLGDKAKAAAAYNGLGNALQHEARFSEAVDAYDESLKLHPGNPGVTSNRLTAERRGGGGEMAVAEYRKLIARLKPRARTMEELMTLANAYGSIGDETSALATYRKAAQLYPDAGMPHLEMVWILLMNGQFEQGWKELEHRWRPDTGYSDNIRSGFLQPMWTGETPGQLGGSLLVIGEQGFGDGFQFARYVRLLAEAGHDIIYEVHPGLVKLFTYSFRGLQVRVIPRNFYRWDKWRLGWLAKRLGQRLQTAASTEVYGRLPFKAWTGVMSLPLRFGTTLDDVPAAVPYLSVPQGNVQRWRARIGALPGRLKVGLVWAGNTQHADDYKRSIAFSLLQPLMENADIHFVALQKGPAAGQFAPADNATTLSDELHDFIDTAAAIEALDLVLSVDTSVAHLAGALGKPVWIMIPRVKDWRWLKEGATTPWYPTARLFRQHVQGEWPAVIADVAAALEKSLAIL